MASLTIGPLPANLANTLLAMSISDKNQKAKPLTVWSLLPYERCLTVLHVTMQKRVLPNADDQDGEENNDNFDPDPLMAKEPMLYQVSHHCFRANAKVCLP